jgi:hypothetical protein
MISHGATDQILFEQPDDVIAQRTAFGVRDQLSASE